MKTNIKKTFASLIVATAIAISISPMLGHSVNMPYSIYESKDSEILSSGVVHEKILKFTSAGWWNINVLRVDLDDPHTDIQGLVNPNGIPNRDKISSMVERSNAVGGINGDYFNYSPLPSAMGTLINNGEVISSPIEKPYDLPTFFIDTLNQAKLGYMDRHTTAKNLNSGQVVFINTINKVTPNFDTVTMLNKHWGKKSIGNRFHKDLIEVLVVDNLVKEVRIGQGPMDIPENGYVLAVRGANHQMLGAFAPGEEIRLDVSTNPGLNNVKFAIGGGSIVLKDGTPTVTDIHSRGNHPRTGIGVSEDGKELILVTLDGRHASFKGVDQKLFGAILKDLGAYNGMNLDGGGSTSMAIKPLTEEKARVVNIPSDGGERSVVNGVGVFSNAPVGELAYIKLSTSDLNMFKDTTRAFTVKGFDEFHNPVPVNENKIKYTCEEAQGEINYNRFTAKTSGKAVVNAFHEDMPEVKGSIELNVLGEVKHLLSDIDSFNLDLNSEKHLPSFTARDGDGYTAQVNPIDIEFTTKKEIGEAKNGIFYSGDTSTAGVLTAKLGEGSFNMIISVGSKATLVEGFENLDKFNFSSYPENVAGSIGLNSDAKEGKSSLALKYDFTNVQADTKAAYVNFKASELPGVPRKLGLWVKGDKNGGWLRGTLKDKNGNQHTIDFVRSLDFEDWKYVQTDLPSNLAYPISLERIYIVETNADKKYAGEILIDGLTAGYPPSVGNVVIPTPSSLKDKKNTPSEIGEGGYSIGVSMEAKALNDIVQYDASSKIKEAFNKHEMSVFLGGASADFNKNLTSASKFHANNVYTRNRRGDVSFININTSKRGIRSSDASQWAKLTKDLETIETNNLIVFLSSPIRGQGGFTDSLEADLFEKLLGEVNLKGKNVFVVHGGSSTSQDLKNGVRYIGLNTNQVTKPEDIYNLSMIDFIVNGPDVTYQIKPLFPRPQVQTNK